MLLKNRPKLVAGLGAATLVLAILIGRFSPEFEGLSFLVGMLIGLSLVFNIKTLHAFRAKRNNSR